jgi:hypothetical protein
MIPVRDQGFYHPFNPDNPNSIYAQNQRAAEEQVVRGRRYQPSFSGFAIVFAIIVAFLIFTSRQFDVAIPMIVLFIAEPLIGIALFVVAFRFLRLIFRRAR